MGIQMEFGNGIALLARDQIDLRQKVAVSRALSMEVLASVPVFGNVCLQHSATPPRPRYVALRQPAGRGPNATTA